MTSPSSARPVTSISWRASIEVYNRDLKPAISDILQSGDDLPNLVNKAEEMIKMFSADQRNIFTFQRNDRKSTVNLHAVMSAMLTCVEECGGESGKRYVASAIMSCGGKGDDNMIELLAALGTTWLTHLLFIFRTSRSCENEEPSRSATPTQDRTTSLVAEEARRRRRAFKEDLMVRDGYTCVVTGLYDVSHRAPNPDPDLYPVTLRACHILRRAIGDFDKDPESDSFISAVTSFDLLANFTGLSVKELEELHENLDDPSNGMLLQGSAHDAFGNFCWCLKPTETRNVYSLKVLRRLGLSRKPHENMLVTFEDHSGDFTSGSSRKTPRSIPRPNPHYLAIHAAIAEVLHMSGAGKFFDELFDEYARR